MNPCIQRFIVPFTNEQISVFTESIEEILWSERRPPPEARDQVREGHRFDGY